MESTERERQHAAWTLAALDATRNAVVRDVRLPPGYLVTVGAAVALHVGTLAWWLARPGVAVAVVTVAATVLMLLVLGWQVRRFRATNGVALDGFLHRAAFGTTVAASVSYAAGLGFATWAAFADAWWLVPPIAAAAGVGYALSGERWLRRYRAHPAVEAAGPSWPLVLVAAAGALAGLVLLLGQR